MKKRKTERKVVWKDTNKYSFTLKYQYPLSIRNRCLFFWGTTLKGWKALLNLADRLTESNRICIVYLYGDAKEELVERHVKKLNNPKVIVLWASYISSQDIVRVNKGIENINIVKKWGCQKNKEDLGIDEIFCFDYKSIIHDWFESHRKLAEGIEEGKRANENIIFQTTQKGFVVVGRNQIISAKENEHIQCILKEIRSIYLYGAESDTDAEYAYKMLHFEKWCRIGINKNLGDLSKLGVNYDDGSQPVQLSLFDNTSWGILEFIKEFCRICDNEMEKIGYVDLCQVIHQMSDSPFGLYQCNYYGLCIGIALRKYVNGYYISGRLITTNSKDVDFPSYIKFIFGELGKPHSDPVIIYTQSSEQIQLCKKLLCIFKKEWDPKIICLENILAICRCWVKNNIHYDTIQRISPTLFKLLNLWNPDVYSKQTEKYNDWLTDEKIEKLKTDLKNVDKNFFDRILEVYGSDKAKLYKKSHYVDGGAVGWLYSTEMVDEGVEWYMKQTICRECGAVIHDYNEVYENGFRGNHARITKSNIVNLNKKLLGRYQKEFFCLRCLCEEFDCTEWEMYEKMQSFKEQGCELF